MHRSTLSGLPALVDQMGIRATRQIGTDLGTSCLSDCQVQGGADLANYFRPLLDGYWAVPPLGRGMNSYPKIPRAWWSRIAEEYAAGMSGPELAKKYGVGSTRTIYLILEKVRREQRCEQRVAARGKRSPGHWFFVVRYYAPRLLRSSTPSSVRRSSRSGP